LKKLRVAWISTETLDKTPRGFTSSRASLRYRMTIPSAALQRLGCESTLVYLSPNANRRAILSRLEGMDAAVIGKVMIAPERLEKDAPALLQLAADLAARGTRVLADFSDNTFEYPIRGAVDRSLANVVDTVVASTPALAELMRTATHVPVVVVTDPVEGERGEPRVLPAQRSANAPHRLLWFGHWTNFPTLRLAWEQLETLAGEVPIALTVYSTPGVERESAVAETDARWRELGSSCRFRPWSAARVFEALRESDAVIIPSEPQDPQKLVKSPNRFTESVWAGRFVVAHPLPAYEPFSASGWVGADLGEGLRWSLANPEQAAARIRTGQAIVAETHTPEAVAKAWKSVIEGPPQRS
jgi:glycosyltransferase involved in cell wall biosynthesis